MVYHYPNGGSTWCTTPLDFRIFCRLVSLPSMRSVGQAVTWLLAMLWRFSYLLFAAGACWSLYSTGLAILTMAWGEFTENLLSTVAYVWILHTAVRRMPRGRLVTRLYLELDRLIRAHPDGQKLVVDGDEPVILMCRRRPFRRGFLRTCGRDIDPPMIDNPGFVSGEIFVVIPASNLVLRNQVGSRFNLHDDDTVDILDQHTTTIRQDFKAAWFTMRTGSGFASAGELRELIDQIQQARPIENGMPDSFVR